MVVYVVVERDNTVVTIHTCSREYHSIHVYKADIVCMCTSYNHVEITRAKRIIVFRKTLV